MTKFFKPILCGLVLLTGTAWASELGAPDMDGCDIYGVGETTPLSSCDDFVVHGAAGYGYLVFGGNYSSVQWSNWSSQVKWLKFGYADDDDATWLGQVVGGGMDADGDSYSDVLLGDIYYLDVANPVDSIGEAWLIYNIVESSNRPTIELDGMGICTYASITCILGEQQQDYFSCSMSWAADMFNSGMATHEDFVIGASLWDDTSEVDVGRAYLFLGAASFSDTEYATDGSVIVFTGENEYDHFGCASTSLDPIELGTNAVVVGASWYDKSSAGSIARNNCGRAYIFFESSTLASISAVNADIIITGEDDDNFFGCSMASGDFISGGGIDLAVGAYGYDRYKGRVYVFSAATLLSDSDGLVEASEATLKFTGENALDMFGASLDCADEFFNGSSRDALLVGAPGYSTGSTIQSGKIYVYDMDDSPPTGVDYFAYGITDVARVGTSVTGLGDLNGQLPSRDEIAFNGDGIVRIHDEQ